MIATAQKQTIPITVDGFLVSATRLGPGKHKLIDGVIVAMAPASPTHETIQAHLAYVLKAHCSQVTRSCRVMTEASAKPRVRGGINTRVPDLLVPCGPSPQPGDQLVHDSILSDEVLSPSDDDEAEGSIMTCASVPSVQEMLDGDSSHIFVEIWRRDASGAWPTEAETVTTGSLQLACIELAPAVADIYAGTHLAVS
jgi:Uma2 family endonuclease